MTSVATSLLLNRMWPTAIKHHGVSVTYVRNNVTFGPFTFVKGRQNIDPVDGGEGFFASVIASEWYALTSELRIAGLNEPKAGDRLRWTDPSGTLQEVELIASAGNRTWTYIDNEGVIVQLFTAVAKI